MFKNSLKLSDCDFRVKVGGCGLDPVYVPHEDGMFELDVGLVLVLQLLRVDSSNPGPELKVKS